MLKLYRLENGRVVPADESNANIFFYYRLDSQEDYQVLVEKFGIDIHAVKSAADSEEIARIDHNEDYTFLVCKRPHLGNGVQPENDDRAFQVSSLGMFIFNDKLLIVNDEDIPVADLQSNIQPFENFVDLVLHLIRSSTLHFFEEFRAIRDQVKGIETALFDSTSDPLIRRLFELEKNMIRYLDSLGSNNAMLERLLHEPELLSLGKKKISFLKNLMIDSRQCYQQAEVASEIMGSLTDTAASLVNNKLSLIMKRLTVLSLIFLPINAIAGIGGMSEFTTASQQLGLSIWTAYSLLGLAMIGIAYVTYAIIKRIDNGTV